MKLFNSQFGCNPISCKDSNKYTENIDHFVSLTHASREDNNLFVNEFNPKKAGL